MIKPVNDSGNNLLRTVQISHIGKFPHLKNEMLNDYRCRCLGEGFGSPVLCLAGVIQLELVLQIVYAYHNLPKFPMMFRLIVD